MVVLLGFSVFKDEVICGSKRQTIRKIGKRLSKKPVKVGDVLRLYWHLRRKDCKLLREDVCTETFFISMQYVSDYLHTGQPIWRVDTFKDLNCMGCKTMMDFKVEELAKRDGFKSAADMMQWFNKAHPDSMTGCDIRPTFQVIRW